MSILFFATGLMAPLWALIAFIAVWLILFLLGCVWMVRRHPWRVVLLPHYCRDHLVWRPARWYRPARLDALTRALLALS